MTPLIILFLFIFTQLCIYFNSSFLPHPAGIKNRLSHFHDELGVKILWLNPVYVSPQVDNGYDISDHTDIDPMFGTLDDMKELIQEMHDNGGLFIKL